MRFYALFFGGPLHPALNGFGNYQGITALEPPGIA
jgi:hypothetical protein